jgi:purine-binding chemotaxis protein CheW
MSEAYEEKHKYLVYRIHDELYASPLLDFKEVIEYTPPKLVPNMATYFTGMINLRGLIIGVVDIRKKLGYSIEVIHKASFLICDTELGPLAATIDRVEAVIQLSSDQIQDMKLDSRIKACYLNGFVQQGEDLITVLDIKKLISDFNENSLPSEAA